MQQLSSTQILPWDDLDRASAAFRTTAGAPYSAWDEFRGRYLPVPDWYDNSLDPLTEAYALQQDRLWQQIVGTGDPYAPERDELSGGRFSDPRLAVVRPGLYRAPTSRAGEHMIAYGHLLKHSGVNQGDRVIEYGPGAGLLSVTFARCGAEVDSVDVDPDACAAINEQAKWFGIPLKAHVGQFGDNPSGEQYKLILFYEAFHHAREFCALTDKLRSMLASEGKILMAGEPIWPRSDSGFSKSVPYAWGIRLDAACVAVIRHRRWFELGFKEEFIIEYFWSEGFVYRKHNGIISNYANVFEFLRRPDRIELSQWRFPPDDDCTWFGVEPNGRWTKAKSTITLDRANRWNTFSLYLKNHHPRETVIAIGSLRITFVAGESKTITLPRPSTQKIEISCDPIRPSTYGRNDSRDLGIFCQAIEYGS